MRWRRAIANLSVRIHETGAEISHDPLPAVRADAGQLVQLFQNLIENALKFRRDTVPRIHVAAARADAAWEIRVADNGIGIDPEHRKRIFELFQRLHTRREFEGTGIGLAVCQKIVQRWGGEIRAEENPGGERCSCSRCPIRKLRPRNRPECPLQRTTFSRPIPAGDPT